MHQRWGGKLLALLFCSMLALGMIVPRSHLASVMEQALVPSILAGQSGEVPPAARIAARAADLSNGRASGPAKSDQDAAGDTPNAITTLVIVAIALVFALPLRGSQVARALRIGLTPEEAYREAGRCPTGPPLMAA